MEQPVVLVTGASLGIGRSIAKHLAQNGYIVFGTSRQPQKAEPIPGVTLIPLEIQSGESIQACIQCVVQQTGRIDALINNAGLIGPAGASEEISIEEVRTLFEINFFGVVQITNTVLPFMREQRSGTIINISSAGGLVSAPPFFSFYAASKHALEGYTEGLRYEVKPFNIRVVLIEPGYTNTEIGTTIQQPKRPLAVYDEIRRRVTRLDLAAIRYGSPPEMIAHTVLNAIRHPAPALRYPVGADSRSILFLKRILPFTLFEQIVTWLFYGWRPRTNNDEIPSLAEMGFHRYLFHGPTLVRTQRTGFTLDGIGFLLAVLSRILKNKQ